MSEPLDEQGATEFILARCRDLGFSGAGVCAAAASDHEGHVLRWIRAGRHGEMTYLDRRIELRLDPRRLVPGARSIVVVADRYADGAPDRRDRPLVGRIARYARGRDYHEVLRERLEGLRDECLRRWPTERFRVCVDTAPLLEREHAARAGLGAIGKHTLLLEPGLGSWSVLGAIVTTLRLPGGEPIPALDACGACTRCIDACPTQCIEPWSVDASACISYLTIEHRSAIDVRHHAAMGDWLVGCDVCQEVCPHGQPTRRGRAAKPAADYAPRRAGFDLLEILEWDEADRAAAFRGTALERVSLEMLQRNAIIVAVNTCPAERRGELAGRLEALSADPERSDLIRATAATSLTRLGEE